MSQTFALVCEETQCYVWIGQGWGKMTNFYTGDVETMAALHQFLLDHLGKPLRFICTDTNDEVCDYAEYTYEHGKLAKVSLGDDYNEIVTFIPDTTKRILEEPTP